MRPVQPTSSGRLTLEGFQIYYETFGDPDAPPVLLLPTWQIVHSRHWKMQVPYLSRFLHVITYDSPGNGGGERTEDPAAFEYDRIVDQGVALLDHLRIEQADVIAFSRGCYYAIWMAARYPERVKSLVLIGGAVTPEVIPPDYDPKARFWAVKDQYQGADQWNGNYWLEHYDQFVRWFFSEFFTEPHTTKGFVDCVGWAHETKPEILVQTAGNRNLLPRMQNDEAIARVKCPTLVIHGEDDRISSIENSRKLVEARPDF